MNTQDHSMNRRELISTAVALGGASLILGNRSVAGDESSIEMTKPAMIIDTNVSLFQWPFRRLPLDVTERLVSKLKELNIQQAWAGSFEGILHRNLTAVNQHLAEECNKYDELIPIGTINPAQPGWESDFQRCCEVHQMPGIRLYPNYHQYGLHSESLIKLLSMAQEQNRFVQIACAVEDTRTQHELVHIPDVDLAPLSDLLQRPDMPVVQILNARLRPTQLQKFTAFKNLYFDTTRIDGTDGLSQMLKVITPERVCFGTHAPFLVPEAAMIRMIESPLTDQQREILFAASSQSLIKAGK